MPARRSATAVEADQVEHLVDTPFRQPVGGGQGRQVAAGVAAGVGRPGVQQRTDRFERDRKIPVGEPADGRPPRRRGLETHDHPHRRRLAGAVRPEETGHDAGSDLKAQIADGLGAAEALGQVFNNDHAIAPRSGRSTQLSGAPRDSGPQDSPDTVRIANRFHYRRR